MHCCVILTCLHAQVPLGVILKNENQLEGMVSIMETLEKYVPCTRKSYTVPSADGDGAEPDTIETDHFNQILFGRDQLTCARGRGAQRKYGYLSLVYSQAWRPLFSSPL